MFTKLCVSRRQIPRGHQELLMTDFIAEQFERVALTPAHVEQSRHQSERMVRALTPEDTHLLNDCGRLEIIGP